jgi:hypothetical protein
LEEATSGELFRRRALGSKPKIEEPSGFLATSIYNKISGI